MKKCRVRRGVGSSSTTARTPSTRRCSRSTASSPPDDGASPAASERPNSLHGVQDAIAGVGDDVIRDRRKSCRPAVEALGGRDLLLAQRRVGPGDGITTPAAVVDPVAQRCPLVMPVVEYDVL